MTLAPSVSAPGVVAIGGKAKVGLANAQPSAALAGIGSTPLAKVVGDGLTPVSDLSRKPSARRE